MTDQEAFEAWKAQPLNRLSVSPEKTWHAALAYLRSQQEPVAWIACRKSGESCAFEVGDPDLRLARLDCTATFTPLYLAPQPAIPDGWRPVPVEPTEEMFQAGDATFVPTYTGTPVSDPATVWGAMLAAAPEPPK